MKQKTIQTQQHLLLTNQVGQKPVKKVPNLASNNPVSWHDLCGLSWNLFEEIHEASMDTNHDK